MTEKLLNTQEVSKFLDIPEEEVRELVERGELPAYRLGGTLLRFKKAQIEEIKTRGFLRISELEKEAAAAPPSWLEKLKDFFYFNDFYITSVIIAIVLLVVIFCY